MDGQNKVPENTPFSPPEATDSVPATPPPAQPVSAAPAAPSAPDAVAELPNVPEPSTFSVPAENEQPLASQDDVSWTAPEFVAHPKNSQWYALLAGATLVVAALAYLITRDFVAVVVVFICGGLFGYMAARQPGEQQYAITSKGINIGPKLYPFTDFSGFSVFEEGDFSTIDLMPLKRFAPMLTIACDGAQEHDVMEALTHHIPFSNHKRSMIDVLMHRIGF